MSSTWCDIKRNLNIDNTGFEWPITSGFFFEYEKDTSVKQITSFCLFGKQWAMILFYAGNHISSFDADFKRPLLKQNELIIILCHTNSIV